MLVLNSRWSAEISYLAIQISLDFSLNFHLPIVIIQKTIMQIKSLIIDNIHYISFITFNISTLFFLICPAEIGVRLIHGLFWFYGISTFGGTHGVIVIVVGNGHGDSSSNPGRDWLHFK